MAEAILDAARALKQFITTQDVAAPLRERIAMVNGAVQIYDTGDLTQDELNAAEDARRMATDRAVILALTVQDDGESPGQYPDQTIQQVSFRLLDRRVGYHNIRQARDALLNLFPIWDSRVVPLGIGSKHGMLSLRFMRRSGHRFDRDYAVQFEVVTYRVTVIHDIG